MTHGPFMLSPIQCWRSLVGRLELKDMACMGSTDSRRPVRHWLGIFGTDPLSITSQQGFIEPEEGTCLCMISLML